MLKINVIIDGVRYNPYAPGVKRIAKVNAYYYADDNGTLLAGEQTLYVAPGGHCFIHARGRGAVRHISNIYSNVRTNRSKLDGIAALTLDQADKWLSEEYTDDDQLIVIQRAKLTATVLDLISKGE